MHSHKATPNKRSPKLPIKEKNKKRKKEEKPKAVCERNIGVSACTENEKSRYN
jgi:hypothetical protein